jgi:hypothetical protein
VNKNGSKQEIAGHQVLVLAVFGRVIRPDLYLKGLSVQSSRRSSIQQKQNTNFFRTNKTGMCSFR